MTRVEKILLERSGETDPRKRPGIRTAARTLNVTKKTMEELRKPGDNPRLEALVAIADALGVSLYKLMDPNLVAERPHLETSDGTDGDERP